MAPLAKIPRLDLDTEIVKQLQMLYAENPEGLISYLLPNTRAILIVMHYPAKIVIRMSKFSVKI